MRICLNSRFMNKSKELIKIPTTNKLQGHPFSSFHAHFSFIKNYKKKSFLLCKRFPSKQLENVSIRPVIRFLFSNQVNNNSVRESS